VIYTWGEPVSDFERDVDMSLWDLSTARREYNWSPRSIVKVDPHLDITTYKLLHRGAGMIKDMKGRLYTFGMSHSGTLGNGFVEGYCWTPKMVEALQHEKIMQVASSGRHTLFRNDKEQIFGCGGNRCYQSLGRRSVRDCNYAPQLVTTVPFPMHVVCGTRFSGIISARTGQIWTWGLNIAGVLGQGIEDPSASLPCPVVAITGRVASFCCGDYHCLALVHDDRISSSQSYLWTFGNNNFGCLGSGKRDEIMHCTPFKMKRTSPVRQIACGGMNNAFISYDGSLFMWGWNVNGECGCVGLKQRCVCEPTRVVFGKRKLLDGPNLDTEWKGRCLVVSCSSEHSLAIFEKFEDGGKKRRMCFAWGSPKFGRLGLGLDEDQAPVLYPQEILAVNILDEELTVISIGVGVQSSFCLVGKVVSYHLDSLPMQDEKLELMKAISVL